MSKFKIRELFVNAPKRIEIGFYTSSIDKFIQARLVFQKIGLILRHFKSSQEPYHEDYDLGQEQLLARAIDEVKYRLGVNSLFFVEDTSVKIDALSSADKIVPGIGVKEWFARTSFKELDVELRQHGNNRSATVYSDIALHVPNLKRPVFIHGETSGFVAQTPPNFEKSAQYPWLRPDSFNGWFVPSGARKRLGEMSFEESLEYDFRVKSFSALIDRLEEFAAILNLSGSYSMKQPKRTTNLSLFKEDVSLYVVVGKLCAGKTTLGEYVSSRYQYRFIEASSVMRLIAEENGINAPTPLYLAKEVFDSKGPDIIARYIVGMYEKDLSNGTIISGFRLIEEVKYIRGQFPNCKVVFIDASERTRFERHLRRGRIENIRTLEDFREHDKQQLLFGLLPIAHNLADIKIENEGTIEYYHAQIDALLEGAYGNFSGVSEIKLKRKVLQEARIFRCLRALEQFPGPATCSDIAKLTQRDAPISDSEHIERISARHVNWVLKDFPELARRINVKGDKLRYEILPAGRTYIEAVQSMEEENDQGDILYSFCQEKK
jgi:dephospho-CoA kinase/inosine/xanthosine triphosphate pyrophosphatase family protein